MVYDTRNEVSEPPLRATVVTYGEDSESGITSSSSSNTSLVSGSDVTTGMVSSCSNEVVDKVSISEVIVVVSVTVVVELVESAPATRLRSNSAPALSELLV